jgi:hypothetical protein
MGFFISTMVFLLLFSFGSNCSNVQAVQIVQRARKTVTATSTVAQLSVISRRPFFGFYQPSVRAIAVRMIFRFPATADGDGLRLFKLQNKRPNVCHCVGAIAERQIITSRAAAIRHALRDLLDDRGFNQVIVG